MKGVKPFIVFSVLQLVLLRNPCDGQFHWGKNYRLEANTLANLLLGNEDSADENMKVSFVSNRLTLKRQWILNQSVVLDKQLLHLDFYILKSRKRARNLQS